MCVSSPPLLLCVCVCVQERPGLGTSGGKAGECRSLTHFLCKKLKSIPKSKAMRETGGGSEKEGPADERRARDSGEPKGLQLISDY